VRKFYLKTAAASAGLAATATYGAPARADWTKPDAEIGAYLSYTFGENSSGGFGFGLQARAFAVGGHYFCGDNEPSGLAAGIAQIGLVDFTQPRLVVGAQAGVAIGGVYSAAGELAVGYRFGRNAGLETMVGMELVGSYANAHATLDPRRGELALGVGFRIPRFGANERCAVIGRALRVEEGIAARPELRLNGESESGVTAWCDRARTEWASVPAFFELAEQLIAAEAPAALVDRAYRAASDEVRHAFLSAGIAAEAGGGTITIDPTGHARRAVARGVDGVVRLAVESWIDGCLGEGAAASVARAEAGIEEASPRIRAVQRSIARDEAQHAELAWDILAWASKREPDAVRDVLAEIKNAEIPAPTPQEDLRAFGCLDAASIAEVGRAQRKSAEYRLAALLSRS
jgi:hypothetical protein